MVCPLYLTGIQFRTPQIYDSLDRFQRLCGHGLDKRCGNRMDVDVIEVLVAHCLKPDRGCRQCTANDTEIRKLPKRI